jgi:hypothetical protein
LLEDLDEVKERRAGLGLGGKRGAAEQRALAGRKEAFGHGVVRAITESEQSPTEPIEERMPEARQRSWTVWAVY